MEKWNEEAILKDKKKKKKEWKNLGRKGDLGGWINFFFFFNGIYRNFSKSESVLWKKEILG